MTRLRDGTNLDRDLQNYPKKNRFTYCPHRKPTACTCTQISLDKWNLNENIGKQWPIWYFSFEIVFIIKTNSTCKVRWNEINLCGLQQDKLSDILLHPHQATTLILIGKEGPVVVCKEIWPMARPILSQYAPAMSNTCVTGVWSFLRLVYWIWKGPYIGCVQSL